MSTPPLARKPVATMGALQASFEKEPGNFLSGNLVETHDESVVEQLAMIESTLLDLLEAQKEFTDRIVAAVMSMNTRS